MIFDCRLECSHTVKADLSSPPASPSHLALICPICHGKFHVLEVTADLSKPVKVETVKFPHGDVETHTYQTEIMTNLAEAIEGLKEAGYTEVIIDHAPPTFSSDFVEPVPEPGGHSGAD